MPKRSTLSDDARYLTDIREHVARVATFLGASSYEDFVSDDKTAFAVVRCLEIISEASRRLSAGLKERHPHIDWGAMAGAGNVYRHDYEVVDLHQVWRTVHDDLPLLSEAVEREIGREKPSR